MPKTKDLYSIKKANKKPTVVEISVGTEVLVKVPQETKGIWGGMERPIYSIRQAQPSHIMFLT